MWSFFVCIPSDVVYLVFDADSIIITDTSPCLAQKIIKQLGQLDYFLGIQFMNLHTGSVLLTQSKYIKDLLQKRNTLQAKAISFPMMSTCKLSKNAST